MKTRLLTLFLAFAPLVFPALSRASGDDVFQESVRGVVWIENHFPSRNVTYDGSGFLIDRQRRWVVTNYHVVEDERAVDVYFPVQGRNGGWIGDRDYYRNHRNALAASGFYAVGHVIAKDRTHDLAILRLDNEPYSAQELELEDEDPQPNSPVTVIGNPGDQYLWHWNSGSVRQSSRFDNTYSDGLSVNFQGIYLNAHSNHGNSGGPVVDDAGKVVGVLEGGAGDILNFSVAISDQEIHDLLATIRTYRQITVRNATNTDIYFSVRFGDAPWKTRLIHPGRSWNEWGVSGLPEIRFDGSYRPGFQERQFTLGWRYDAFGEGGFNTPQTNSMHYVFTKFFNQIRLSAE
jgi:S1-C subfamily serine protease